MTSGTVEFRQTTYELGETLRADFTWTDAKYNFTADSYAVGSIYNPSGKLSGQFDDGVNSEGSKTLSRTSDALGTWRARLRIWNGSNWTDLSHYCTVVSAPPPSPPPPSPPPSGNEYDITINTTPGHCECVLYDAMGEVVKSGNSGSSGVRKFNEIPEGSYTLKVSKEGYNDWSNSFTLQMNQVFDVELQEPGIWDWIINFVIGGLEGLLGWTSGSLLTALGNVQDILGNFGSQIADFFGGIYDTIADFVTTGIADALGAISDTFIGFVDWLQEIGGDIADYVGGVVDNAVSFVTDGFTNFIDWLSEIGGSVADYVGGAIGDFVDWSQDQLGSIWEGLQTWFMEAIWGFVESFFMGLNDGIEEAKGSPLHSNEPVRNPVLRGLRKVVRKHRKENNRNIITGEKENGDI